MATVKVCDVCKEQKSVLPITVTEADLSVWEACSASCFIKGKKERDSSTS